MKKMTLLLMLLTLSLIFEVSSLERTNPYGIQKYGNEIVDSIQGYGTVTLDATKVLGPVFVNGTLNAEESTMSGLQVNGLVDLKNCTINQSANINGSLNAEGSKFQKELSISSQKIKLKKCSIGFQMILPLIS